MDAENLHGIAVVKRNDQTVRQECLTHGAGPTCQLALFAEQS
jgi:hypothetical protein